MGLTISDERLSIRFFRDFHDFRYSLTDKELRKRVMFAKIVSGGQTGVDRAALDVALELGLPCGGWCPKGRRAEDGCIDERYPLQETPWEGYPQRTEWNVRDSDGTLILTCGEADRGTALTVELAQRKKKPRLVVDVGGEVDVKAIRTWAEENGIRVLNVAGPRESSSPGIHDRAAEVMRQLLQGEAEIRATGP
jgi:hypothetical protein